MRIGLASMKFVNGDIDFNLSEIEAAINKVKNECDMLVFGEAFLQGFDSLSWNYQIDKQIALSQNSFYMEYLKSLSKTNKIDLIIPYIELDNDSIYSSAAVIIDGKISYNYRRISTGWKEILKTDTHYKEGDKVLEFVYKNQIFELALCGDLWDHTSTFQTDAIVIWPVYVDATKEEWDSGLLEEYVNKANEVSNKVLMVNSLTDNGAIGGSLVIRNGHLDNTPILEKNAIQII